MTDQKYYYRAFNLRIVSDFVLFGISEDENDVSLGCDVEILHGNILPEGKRDSLITPVKITYLFQTEDLLRGCVENGNRIIIDPYGDVDDSQISQIILISAFYILLVQRGLVTLHGSSMVINGKSIVVIGESGAGKTSFALSLRKKGYGFLSDDISAVSVQDGGCIIVYPGYPVQRLHSGTALANGFHLDDLSRVAFDEDKLAVPVIVDFCNEAKPLSAIVEICVGDCSTVELEQINGIKKLPILLRHTHNLHQIKMLKLHEAHFHACVEIMKTIPIYRIIRPSLGQTTNEQIDLLMGKMI